MLLKIIILWRIVKMMPMKRFVFMAVALLLAVTVNAQDIQQKYEEAVNLLNTNIDGAKTFLEKWEKEDPKNPELYSLWFNYYFAKSLQSVVELSPEPAANANGFVITDSTGKKVGYLQERTFYNDTLLQMAFSWLDKGIAANPDRLDFYFGMATAALRADKDSVCVETVVKAMDRAQIIGTKWIWTFGESRESEPNLLTECVQDFFISLYQKGNMEQAQALIEAAAARYPGNIMYISNAGILALTKGDLNKALDKFLQAEKLDMKDHVVLLNIAYTYRELGDKDTARKYYSKVIKYCSPEVAAEAKMLMDELDE